jgi:hypothetical protein
MLSVNNNSHWYYPWLCTENYPAFPPPLPHSCHFRWFDQRGHSMIHLLQWKGHHCQSSSLISIVYCYKKTKQEFCLQMQRRLREPNSDLSVYRLLPAPPCHYDAFTFHLCDIAGSRFDRAYLLPNVALIITAFLTIQPCWSYIAVNFTAIMVTSHHCGLLHSPKENNSKIKLGI